MKRFLLLALLLALPLTAQAQRVDQRPDASPPGGPPAAVAPPGMAVPAPLLHDRIAAVVNDNAVSTSDIRDRMKLALMSSGLPPTSEIQDRLLPQILRGLIDEQLQIQEAKRIDIAVSKEEIDNALASIAHGNNIPGDMRDFVKSHGGSPQALEQQIRSSISWNKVIQRELRPRVEVGDDEIDALIERMRANAGKEEYLVGEIFLAVDNPTDDDQVHQVADNLVQQLKSGANFGAVARQFSQSTGAASGGDIGWIQEGQLPAEIDHVLTGMQAGQVAGPIHSANGYHVLMLREKRTITVGGNAGDITLNLQQAFRPFDAGGPSEAVQQEAGQLRGSISGCSDLSSQLAQKFPAWHWQDLGEVKVGKIPDWLAGKVHDVPVGKSTEPMATDKGALIVFVCDRHVPEGNVDRAAILNSIGIEKLELQARRLLRDLRRTAFIDVRLNKS